MGAVSTREDFEELRTFGMWGHRPARQASLRWKGEERGGNRRQAIDSKAIVEKAADAGCRPGPDEGYKRIFGFVRRSERRLHCLRGVKPQGPASFGRCRRAEPARGQRS